MNRSTFKRPTIERQRTVHKPIPEHLRRSASFAKADTMAEPDPKPEAGTRLPRIVQIPHVMTTDCQFTKHNPTDPGCAGCNHQSKP